MKRNTRLMRIIQKMLVLTISLLLSSAWTCHATGMRTKFGEVIVRGLKIGQTYSLNNLIGLPYRVLNTGNKPVQLKLEVLKISTGSTKTGYEPLPDTSWVKLEKTDFDDIEPGHEVVSDIIVSIPNDPKLLGRKYEADIFAHSISRYEMFAVGMQSRLLINIASTPPTEEELKHKFVDEHLADLDFTLYPTVGVATDVPVGLDYDLKKGKNLTLKLVNPNDKKLHFRIRSVPNFEALLALPPGYEEAYDPKWVKPAKEIIEIAGNNISETGLIIHVPNEDRYRGKSFFFPISVEILEQQIPARAYYQLLVTTTKAPTGK